jgi:acyl dehydratase
MKQIRFDDLATLSSMVSSEYGPWSEPTTVSQEMINQFAELTGDSQWIHVDVDRARREGPFGEAIAHGFLVLSLATMIKNSTDYTVVGHGSALNYGLERVRFVSPVPAGSQLQGRTRIAGAEASKGGVMLTIGVAIHVVGQDRPAVSFDWKLLYRP